MTIVLVIESIVSPSCENPMKFVSRCELNYSCHAVHFYSLLNKKPSHQGNHLLKIFNKSLTISTTTTVLQSHRVGGYCKWFNNDYIYCGRKKIYRKKIEDNRFDTILFFFSRFALMTMGDSALMPDIITLCIFLCSTHFFAFVVVPSSFSFCVCI